MSLERGNGIDGTPMLEEKFDKLDFVTCAPPSTALFTLYKTQETLQTGFLELFKIS